MGKLEKTKQDILNILQELRNLEEKGVVLSKKQKNEYNSKLKSLRQKLYEISFIDAQLFESNLSNKILSAKNSFERENTSGTSFTLDKKVLILAIILAVLFYGFFQFIINICTQEHGAGACKVDSAFYDNTKVQRDKCVKRNLCSGIFNLKRIGFTNKLKQKFAVLWGNGIQVSTNFTNSIEFPISNLSNKQANAST